MPVEKKGDIGVSSPAGEPSEVECILGRNRQMSSETALNLVLRLKAERGVGLVSRIASTRTSAASLESMKIN